MRVPFLFTAFIFIFEAGLFADEAIPMKWKSGGELRKPLAVGFNQEYLSLSDRSRNLSIWNENGIPEVYAALRTSILRFPGGTFSDFWNWQTGKLADPIDHPRIAAPTAAWKKSIDADQKGFLSLCSQLQMEPLFVFNLYQSEAPDQVEWVRSVNPAGKKLLVRKWELGNELQLHRWHPGFKWATHMKSADEYVERARGLGQKLLKEFPGIELAANIDSPEHLFHEGQSERTDWNKAVAGAPDFYNAVSTHIYLYHQPDWKASDAERSRWLCSLGDVVSEELPGYSRKYFGEKPLWLTEAGLTGRESADDGLPEQVRWGFVFAEVNFFLRLCANPGPLTVLQKHAGITESGVRASGSLYAKGSKEMKGQLNMSGSILETLFEGVSKPHRIETFDLKSAGTFPGNLRYKDRSFPNVLAVQMEWEGKRRLFILNRGENPVSLVMPEGVWTFRKLSADPASSISEKVLAPASMDSSKIALLPFDLVVGDGKN
ncbi:MAG: hypothetical protein JNM63_12480 [Spirochaetia bacterium]|nr:hypothetical protein [Spirochaetia bacterium]